MHDIKIEIRLNAAENRVFADYDRMRQVLVNLMINAADAIQGSLSASTGKIVIETRSMAEDDPGLPAGNPVFILQVRDNGAGIPKQEIENIFDPFYTTKEPGKGTGLGLSVTYMIIEQSGGTITVKSDAGCGTQFTISLPLYREKGEHDG
jgi:signal transduction histidine kinase